MGSCTPSDRTKQSGIDPRAAPTFVLVAVRLLAPGSVAVLGSRSADGLLAGGRRTGREYGRAAMGTPGAMDYQPGHGADRTLREVLAALEQLGFTAQFMAREPTEIECAACHERHPASGALIHHLERLEGESDPDDMLAVVGLECPQCRARGTTVLGYGPEASLVDAEVLAALEDARR